MSKRIGFTSQEQRDAWLDREYPGRKVTETPGLYDVDGGVLGVIGLDVTFYDDEPDDDERWTRNQTDYAA